MVCPKCGSEDVAVQTHQEHVSSVTTEKRTSKYKEKGHCLLWWLLIGWWWWMVDLFLWIFFFGFRLILAIIHAIFKKRKYVGSETAISSTVNNIRYVTVCTCPNCGNTWTVK